MLHVLCGSKRNHFKLPMHHTILTPTARAIKPTLTSCSVQKQHACESCCDRKTSKKLSRFREMYRIEPTQKIEPEVPHSTDEVVICSKWPTLGQPGSSRLELNCGNVWCIDVTCWTQLTSHFSLSYHNNIHNTIVSMRCVCFLLQSARSCS